LTATATARNGGSNSFAYSWQQTGGPAVTLGTPTSATATFTAPNPGGTHTFRATVIDGNGYVSTQTTSVRSNNPASVPVASPAGPYSLVERRTLAFNVASTDPESDGLTYVVTNLPAGATFNAATGAFSWPNAGPPNTYNLEIRANDGTVNSAPLAVAITVRANTAPTVSIAPVSTFNVTTGQAVNFTSAGVDVDGDGLTYATTGVPAGATFNNATGAFTWPSTGPAGTYSVGVTASDGFLTSAVATAAITVTAPPAPPPSGGGGGGGALNGIWALLLMLALPLARRRHTHAAR
jgi:MYXO-CTERM domain-containing protein